MRASRAKSTKRDKASLVVSAALFGLTIGVLSFASSLSVSVCGELSKETELCHFYASLASASAASAVSAFRYHFRYSDAFVRAYISLAATLTGGFAFYVHTTSRAYSELTRPIDHIRQLFNVPLSIAECLRNETSFSLKLLRNSVLKDPASDINRGVIDIVNGVRQVNQSQNEIKQAIGAGFHWLESRGLNCNNTFSQPFHQCISASEQAKNECLKTGSGILCNVVDVGTSVCKLLQSLNEAICLDLGPNVISEMLSSLRKQLDKLMEGAIRLRVGVYIELKTTSNVEEKLHDAWKPFRNALNKTSDFVSVAYNVTQFLVRYVGFAAILLWPIGYLSCYLHGPLSFDNRYFPVIECERFKETIAKLDLAITKEIRAVSLRPTLVEVSKIARSLLLENFDLFIIGCVLALDFYLTHFIGQLTGSFGGFFLLRPSNSAVSNERRQIEGIQWIERVIARQLETLHNAVGLERLVNCVQPAPPIRYSYSVYYLVICQRLVGALMRIKFPYLSSVICARFYRRRHRIRMRYLKVKELQRILEQQSELKSSSSETVKVFLRKFFFNHVSVFVQCFRGFCKCVKRAKVSA